MGDAYNLYPKLPKNIRQIGERDPVMKLYVEDYVNTYLKRLQPSGGRGLRAGLLLGETRVEDGIPLVFADGALEFPELETDGEQLTLTETVWKQAYRIMEQSFPKRSVVGWFVCGPQGNALSPLSFWKQHGEFFPGKHQIMYLNGSPEDGEAVYISSEDGFYRLRGYNIYYERNQMMQDYMVSRREARRVESGVRDDVIRDFRRKMEDRQVQAHRQTALSGVLGTACGVLSVAVLACGFVLFSNYQRMKELESVIASVLPEEGGAGPSALSALLSKGETEDDGVTVEEIPGNIYPVPEISIGQGAASGAAATDNESGTTAAASLTGSGNAVAAAGNGNVAAAGEPGAAMAVGAETAGTAGTGEGGAGAAAPDVQSVQIPADAVSYVVQEGETLYGICLSRYHSISYLDEICQWNGLEDENHIRAGQELYLPAGQ